MREVILAKLPSINEAAKGETIVVQIPGFVPPKDRMIDYDFALLVFAEQWLNLPRTEKGSAPAFEDVRFDLPEELRTSALKDCLMSLKGEPWTPRAEWPDADDPGNARWTVARYRLLHRAGLVSMPENFHEGQRSYRALLTMRGLVRSVWLVEKIPRVIAEKACPKLLELTGK